MDHDQRTARGAGGYPYPPAQQQQGIIAPGGFPVHSLGPGAPSAYPPQAQIPVSYPPQQQHGGHIPPLTEAEVGKKLPAGYPGAGAPAGSYPPQGSAGPNSYPPATVTHSVAPVAAYPVGTYGNNNQEAVYMEQGGDVAPEQEKCRCSIGWVLFAFGFLLWPCWVVAAFIPLCTRSRSDRLAGWASTGMMLLLVIAGIIVGATSPRWRNSYGYNNYYYG